MTNTETTYVTDAHSTSCFEGDASSKCISAAAPASAKMPVVLESIDLPVSTSTSMEKTIYGRSSESKTLQTAYDRMLETQHAQTVLVHGESGSGKTALAENLRPSVVVSTNGYFVSGKHFQNATVQAPYSAIMAAFSDLCNCIADAKDFDTKRRREITDILESDARLLVKVIPNISSLVGTSIKEEKADQVSFAKFRIACKTFLHAVSSPSHPIVVFLDDVQWADEGSIQLIQMFLQDHELRNIMFVVAYRDEKSEYVVERILDHARDTTDMIALSNLDSSAVHQIVTSILESLRPSRNHQISKLSELVSKWTCGNPLHIMLFMAAIQQKGLLSFDVDTVSWLFNVDDIQKEMMACEGLAELLMRKVEALPYDTKETLKIASFLGYQFDEGILRKVISATMKEKQNVYRYSSHAASCQLDTAGDVVLRSLSVAMEEGFIKKMSNGYQFTHDRLQSSFRSLVFDDFKEDQLRQIIGEVFLSQGDIDCESNIYKAAVHLNHAPRHMLDLSQRVRLAGINLQSAKYCEEISAFTEAVAVLQKGVNILSPEERWLDKHFTLTFTLMDALARMQLVIGDFAACKETTREALRYGKTAEMNINLHLIDVEVRMARNEIDDSLVMAKMALQTLGVKLPRKANLWHVATKLCKVKCMLRHKTDESIINTPITEDMSVINTVKLLMHVCSSSLVKDETETAIFCALLAVEFTLKEGLSQYCPGMFVMYGVAELSLGNINRAYRFGKLALGLLDRVDARESKCHAVGLAVTMLTFRKEPFHELSGHLYQVANKGFLYGDIIYATYCVSQSFCMLVHLGAPLASLECAMRASYGKVCELGQDGQLLWLVPGLQYVLNMQSHTRNWESLLTLTGEIMNEDEHFQEAFATNHAVLILLALFWKAKLAVDFGNFSTAISIFERCKFHGADALHFSHVGILLYFDQARAHYGLFELSGRGRHLRNARKYKNMLHRMDANDCPNASPLLAFLVAQELSLLNKKSLTIDSLRTSFDKGLNYLSHGSNFKNLEGLLNERAGFTFAKRKCWRLARLYFDQALHIYKYEWGAIAKYNELKHTSALALKGEALAYNFDGEYKPPAPSIDEMTLHDVSS